MKNKGFIVLFGLVVCLSLYTYYSEFYQKTKEENSKKASSRIFPLEKDQVALLSREGKDQNYVLEKSIDGWNIQAPFADRADNDSTEAFVQGLAEESFLEVAKEGEGVEPANFGFGGATTRFSLKSNAGAEYKVEISEMKNFEGQFFARRPGESKIYLVASSWASSVARPLSDFEDKRILRGRAADLTRLDLHFPGERIHLVSQEKKWSAPDKPKWVLDANQVRMLISQISSLNAKEIVSRDAMKSSSLLAGKKLLQLDLQLKDKSWTGSFFQGKEQKIYFVNSDPGFVYLIGPDGFKDLGQKKLSDLRDRKTPFDLDVKSVSAIEIENNLKKMSFAHKAGNWQLSSAGDEGEIQSDKVKDLAEKIRNLEVSEFAEGKVSLDGKISRIFLANESGDKKFELFWGPALKRKVKGLEKNMHLAKTSLFDEVFYLDEAALQRLSLNDLVKKKAETAEPPKEEK